MHDPHAYMKLGLQLVADHEVDKAVDAFQQAAQAGSLLGAAMAENLAEPRDRSPYEQAQAFQLFINGGGNVALYAAVHDALTNLHHSEGATSILDIGAGDGHALLPALRARTQLERVGVVEPSAEMLAVVKSRIATAVMAPQTQFEFWAETLQAFVERAHTAPLWSVAQATFSLQSLPPPERIAALAKLKSRVQALVIVEFDVPDIEAGSEEELASIASRFENGLRGYGADAATVASGFLAPILLGKVRDQHRRHNWEQPASQWRTEVEDAGYVVEELRIIAQYSWAPAFVMLARPVAG